MEETRVPGASISAAARCSAIAVNPRCTRATGVDAKTASGSVRAGDRVNVPAQGAAAAATSLGVRVRVLVVVDEFILSHQLTLSADHQEAHLDLPAARAAGRHDCLAE